MLVDIPKDVTAQKTEYQAKEPVAVQRDTGRITEEDLQTALKLIREAKKPYVFVGGGAVISGASEDLREFVDKIDAPVCDSLMGKEHSTVPIRGIPECLACMEPRHRITVSVSAIF